VPTLRTSTLSAVLAAGDSAIHGAADSAAQSPDAFDAGTMPLMPAGTRRGWLAATA
jgi:hypothetical protein